MKQFSKKLLISLLVGMSAVTGAFASEASYTPPKNIAQTAHNSVAVLHNYTGEYYTAYATYQSSGKSKTLQLGPQWSGTGNIYYNIIFPDYTVCLNVVRVSDNWLAYQGCTPSGNINIGPYTVNNKPVVKVQ